MGEKMSNLKNKTIPLPLPLPLPEAESAIKDGIVIAVSLNAAIVCISGKKIKAKKAFSCVIDPEPDDRVICCRNRDGQFYILGIMEREKNEKMKFSFPSDAIFESREGSINIIAKDNLAMASDKMNFFSGKELHKSDEATISFKELTASGNTLMANYKTVNWISRLINVMANQVINKFKAYVRHTEDNDQVKAGQATRNVKGLYSMDSKYTIMVSKESTKIDGEKILMG